MNKNSTPRSPISHFEDDWEHFRLGAQNRSNLFNHQTFNFDLSNRNLKKTDSISSMPSPKELQIELKAQNYTFQDPISEFYRDSFENVQRNDPTVIRMPRIILEMGENELMMTDIWRKAGLKIILLVLKFKNNLKEKTLSYMLKKSKPFQLSMFGDKSFFVDAYQEISRLLWQKKLEFLALENSKNKNIFRARPIKATNFKKAALSETQYLEIFQRTMKQIITCLLYSFAFFIGAMVKLIMHMRPSLKTRILWDITLIIILTTQMWYIPVFSSFEIARESPSLNLWFETVPLIIFSIDIFFNFVTGYYSKGYWVTDKVRIARHYLKKEFWIDVITLIPLYLAYSGAGNDLMALVFMLRFVRISKMFRKIEDHFQLQVKHSSLLNLCKLTITLLFFVHIFSCFWHLVAELEVYFDQTCHTWLVDKGLVGEKWYIKYMASFYFTLVTSVTVGYGDITPTTSLERLCSCLIILFGCGQNAYSINSIGSIFQDMFKEEMALKQQIASLTAYMSKRNVDGNLQLKARRYLEYVNQQEKRAFQKGESVLGSLSTSLRDEIIKNIYCRNFKKDISFFAENYSDNFIDALMLKAKEVSYAPEELIYYQNDNENQSLYFIVKGKVEIYLNLRKQALQMLRVGQGRCFGEQEFLLGTARQFSVRSLECTRLIYVKRKDFLEVLKGFPEDNERFLMIRDRTLLNIGSNQSEVCYFCEKKHNISKCPFLSYHPQKQLALGDWVQSISQRRRRFHRNRVFKTCSLKKIKETNLCADKFFEGHKEDRAALQEAQIVFMDEEPDGKTMENIIEEENRFESRQARAKVEIDKGKNYKWYFPGENVDQYVLNIRNQVFPFKRQFNKSRRRFTSPKKGLIFNSAMEKKMSSFSRASEFMNRGCLWFRRQWPFKKK